MTNQFTITFSFLLLGLHGSHNFLFSRSRNPNEFIAMQDNLALDELDPKMYANLLEEIPELRSHMRRPRPESREPLGMPYRQYKDEPSDEYDKYDYMMNGVEPDVRVTTTTKRALQNTTLNASSENPPSIAPAPAGAHDNCTAAAATAAAGNGSDPRRWGWDWRWQYYWKGPLKATCYYCNMNNGRRTIPIGSLCHDAWNSPDWQAKTMARYFRAHCYYNYYHWGSKIESKKVYERLHETDRGLIRGYYGGYIGGCFKRFLDVGKVYTARGCRSNEVKNGGGFANHRYRKLERELLGQKDACIMSPHASLTPFSRAISLYVRYHVCVCEGKYCNKARPRTTSLLVPLLLVLNVLL